MAKRASNKKLKELILLIASRSQDDATFGATKLNKLLFYSDFLAYVHLGKSITGQDYFALEQGPAPRRLKPVTRQMERDAELAIVPTEFHGKTQKKAIALREPNLTLFTQEQIDLVHNVIQRLWGKTGREVSDMSHRFWGWSLAELKETIPYEVALTGNRAPTLTEIKRGLKLQSLAETCLQR